MSGTEEPTTDELEIARRIKAMEDDQLTDFVRDTVARLNALADRLEAFADETEESGAG